MSIGTQLGLAIAVLVTGWLAGRWASRYDVRSWVTDFFWRLLFRRGWRLQKVDMRDLKLGDAELQRQLGEKAEAFKADAARSGNARALAKHGALFGLAYVVNLVAGPLMLIGLAILAHAAYRYLG